MEPIEKCPVHGTTLRRHVHDVPSGEWFDRGDVAELPRETWPLRVHQSCWVEGCDFTLPEGTMMCTDCWRKGRTGAFKLTAANDGSLECEACGSRILRFASAQDYRCPRCHIVIVEGLGFVCWPPGTVLAELKRISKTALKCPTPNCYQTWWVLSAGMNERKAGE